MLHNIRFLMTSIIHKIKKDDTPFFAKKMKKTVNRSEPSGLRLSGGRRELALRRLPDSLRPFGGYAAARESGAKRKIPELCAERFTVFGEEGADTPQRGNLERSGRYPS